MPIWQGKKSDAPGFLLSPMAVIRSDYLVIVNSQGLGFRIAMRGYGWSDGLYEVEGRVTDTRPNDFLPGGMGKMVPANEPIHDMSVRPNLA